MYGLHAVRGRTICPELCKEGEDVISHSTAATSCRLGLLSEDRCEGKIDESPCCGTSQEGVAGYMVAAP
jgi:hypothetical protein